MSKTMVSITLTTVVPSPGGWDLRWAMDSEMSWSGVVTKEVRCMHTYGGGHLGRAEGRVGVGHVFNCRSG